MTSFFFIMLLLWASPQATPKDGTIEGTVTRFGTGDPIPDVEILLNGKGRSTNSSTPQAITDSRGHFVINDVPPGSYSIRALRMNYANPAPNGVRVLEGGATRTVVVAAGERSENADLTMARAGAIYGRVLDSAGKPFADQFIRVVSTDERGGSVVHTDDHGDYHFVNLAPGKYYVFFETPSSPIYYPGVGEKAKAVVLEIKEGTVLTGIDMTAGGGAVTSESDKTFNISGKIIDRDGTARTDWFQYTQLLSHLSTGTEKTSLYRVAGGGTDGFYYSGVRPGLYDIYLNFDFNSQLGVIGRVEVRVGNDDVKDVVLTAGGVNVSGQITSLGSASRPTATVQLKMPSNSIRSRESKSDAAGNFSIPNVVSGIWKVAVSNLLPEFALLDVRQGDNSVYDIGIAVEDRSPAPIQIVVGPGGTIGGTVRNAQMDSVGAASVLLISDTPDPSHPATQFRNATTDGAGRFTISNVAVGPYQVYALDPNRFPPESIPETAEKAREMLSPEIRSNGVAAKVVMGAKLELLLTSIH